MIMTLESLPFTVHFPVSNFSSLLIQSILITIAITVSDYVIAHGISNRKILFMSLLSYMLTPALTSLVKIYFPLLPSILYYIIPLAIWALLGKIYINKLEPLKRVAITLLGYGIFLLLNYIGLQSIISSILKI